MPFLLLPAFFFSITFSCKVQMNFYQAPYLVLRSIKEQNSDRAKLPPCHLSLWLLKSNQPVSVGNASNPFFWEGGGRYWLQQQWVWYWKQNKDFFAFVFCCLWKERGAVFLLQKPLLHNSVAGLASQRENHVALVLYLPIQHGFVCCCPYTPDI